MKNILLIGSGGREHALAAKIIQSPLLNKLFIAPGNAGTAQCGTNVNLSSNDFQAIKQFCVSHNINMIVVGPEEPLVKGIADYIHACPELSHVDVVGPVAKAALLEGSKDFAKQFMKKYNIPTAAYKTFTKNTFSEALDFIKTIRPPYVLKADGLAAGKGVLISSSLEQAENELRDMLLNNKFGDAGKSVVIEEFLNGTEVSVFAAADGKNFRVLPYAKDYKKIGENDKGPNTGGMGAVSPAPFMDNGLMDRIISTIIEPTVLGLINEGIIYKGFIFFGLMIADGAPYVIEYNARLGDPETEVIIPRIKSDIIPLFKAICDGTLPDCTIETDSGFTSTVMLVSQGYPGEYDKGKPIRLDTPMPPGTCIYHAGTTLDASGNILTNGGRVMAVTASGLTLEEALAGSYEAVKKIDFEGMYHRSDIGKDMLKFLK